MRQFLRVAVLSGVLAAVSPPVSALAVTVDEIVGLSRAGVTDAIILALIDRDKSILAIGPDDIVKLQREGVSQAVIVAMLKSGRAEGDDAARVDAADTAAFIASRLGPEPDLLIVGHGPDRPNASYRDGFYPPGADPYYVLPYVVGSGRRHRRSAPPAVDRHRSFEPPAVGFVAPWNPSRSPFAVPPVPPVPPAGVR